MIFYMRIFSIIIFSLFAFSSFAGQKVIEKGIMEVTDDKTGDVTYKILWRAPDGGDRFWIPAAPLGSADAYSGSYAIDVPGLEPLPAITIGDFTATEEGMKRAARAIADMNRPANTSSDGDSGGGGGNC